MRSHMRSRMRRQSLRTKMIAWSVLPTAIILIIIAWVTRYAYQQVTEDLIIKRDRELTRLIANELARELGQHIKTLSILGRTERRTETVARNLVLEQVSGVVTPRMGGGGNAYLVDKNGKVIYDQRGLRPPMIGEVSDRRRTG